MMGKRALITGVTGQDGSYLADLLLAKGYEVHAIIRRTSTPNTERIAHVLDRLHLHSGDLLDGGSLTRIVRAVRPDEVYHLGAQSHVGHSFEEPEHTIDATGVSTVRLLDAVRHCGRDARFYFAGSSEMFGSAPAPQTESTPFAPQSPYAAAKVLGFHLTRLYREAYKMHASSGILMNHESERRGVNFVTRKITLAAANIKRGLQRKLRLGNLDAVRDWGYAADYVEAMWMMLQKDRPDDYVIATGEAHTVREFVEEVFLWHGLDWKKYVEIDPSLYRPTEVNMLRGDASKAQRVLGWKPTVKFAQLARMMAAADDKLIELS
jgi:GDPmannose 4,6-dehydratase